jgi:phospholipid N-methyltransferase
VSDASALFREFLRAPTRVATLTASSDALVAAMLAPLDLDADPVVVELGAGTGRVTDALARRLAGRGRHVAIELNTELARRLAARQPGVTVVCADAGTLPAVLRDHGIDRVDVVSSLLPWVAWANAPIADLAADSLTPAGTFTQVTLLPTTWMPPARRQERTVRTRFAEVAVSPPVWANLPPARVLVARRPRPATPRATPQRPIGQ